MQIRDVKRDELRDLLATDQLRKGHMLVCVWPRLTAKYGKDIEGNRILLEAKGTIVERRCVLRNDWTKPTPSQSFVPKDGIMFNVESQARAAEIRAVNDLALFLSLEGITHPHGEKDHPVNVPLKHLIEIRDTRDDVIYRVTE